MLLTKLAEFNNPDDIVLKLVCDDILFFSIKRIFGAGFISVIVWLPINIKHLPSKSRNLQN